MRRNKLQMPADRGRLGGVFGSLLVRRFTVRQPEMYRVIETVSAKQLTRLDKAALCDLAQTAMDLEFDGVDGDFLQAGGVGGGAAIVIAHAKRRSRVLAVHDLLNADGDAEARVRRELAEHEADERSNVSLIVGPYRETLATEGPLALVHLDCAEYEPMCILLERLAGRLVPGGHLIVDDYLTQEECKRAVNDHFRGKKGFSLVRKTRLHVIKS